MRRTALAVASVATLALLASCQSGGGDAAPTTPAGQGARLPIPVGSADQGWVGAGVVDLTIDTGTLEATLTPVRIGSAIGDTYSELGLMPGFTELFGRNLQVEALRLTGPNTVELDLAITHPFTAAIRPDLAIFNLKCYVVTDGATGVPAGAETLAPGILSNADGYGNMWSLTADTLPAFTHTTLQPYIVMREDPSAGTFDFQNPAGYNVFFPGQSSVDTLALTIPNGTSFAARLYLTADYGQSAVRATRQSPAYELPQFAGNAAWKIDVRELTNDLQASNPSSTATYQIDIWDWKHGQGFDSDIVDATFFVPGVMASAQTLALSGTGTDPSPLTATTLITNAQSAGAGSYWGVVEVTDSATGVGLKEDLATPVSIGAYRTWQVVPVAIEDSTVPPTAQLAVTNCDSNDIAQGMSAAFDASGSTAGDNPIISYEWDFDYDGSTFTVDATGLLTSRPCPVAGTFTVALRVTDSFPLADIDTTTITVTMPPAAWLPVSRLTNDALQPVSNGEGDEALTVGPDGTVYLMYLAVGATRQVEVIEYDSCPTGGWSTPQVVAVMAAAGSNMMPSSKVDLDGNLHAIYWDQPGQWFHRKRTAGVWGGVTPITGTPPSGHIWQPAARSALGIDGRLAFAAAAHPMGTLVCPGVPAPQSPIMFAEFTGTSWSPPTQIAGIDCITSVSSCGGMSWQNETLDIVGLATGDWLTVWEDLITPYTGSGSVASNQHLGWIRQTGGVWGTEQTQNYGATGNMDQMRLARDPAGIVWCAFRRSASDTSLIQYNGTSWSPSHTVVLTGVGGYPRINMEISPNGQGIIFASSDAGTTELRIKRFRHTDPIGSIVAMPYEQPQPIQAFGRNNGGAITRPDGGVVTFWRSAQWGTGNLYEFEGTAWE